MKIGFTDIKKVFVTLPIGYYAFGRIPAVLEQHGRGTCYSPLENKIYLDAEQIEKLCGTIPDDMNPEMFIRSCLYHELSHALLTPNYPTFPYILNVMEDERIETVLKDYYDGVDFFKNITMLNAWDGTCDEVPNHPTEAFYAIVRYHVAPPTADGTRPSHLVEEAKNIVISYSSMDATSAPDSWRAKNYVNAIRNFYDRVKTYYPENENEDEDQQNNESENNGEGEGNNENSNSGSNSANSNVGDSQRNGAQSGQRIGDKDEDYTPNEQDKEKTSGTKDTGEIATNGGEGSKPMGPRPAHINPRLDAAINRIVHEMQETIPEHNPRLYQALDRIFTSFNKKNHGGASMNCYSGILNPRNCAREDYRFWEKKAPVNGANKFGTAHLNLFIDVSGSMYDSIRYVNQLLETMYRLTKTHKEITFSVMAMGEGQRKVDTFREPYLTADGGNDLTSDIIQQYRNLQKKNTAVYNLVVFDGCAYSRGGEKNFSAFNHNNCTIISDSDNEDPINQYAPQARRVITRDYAKDFVNSVIKALEIAFR